MSNFRGMAVHPETLIEQEADWLDDYFAPRQYGIQFEGGGRIYTLCEVIDARLRLKTKLAFAEAAR